MIIDAHAHVTPDHLAAASAKVFEERNKFSWIYDGTVGTLVRLMDEAGVSKAVITNNVVNPDFNAKANDFTASKVKEYPDRLVGFSFIHPGCKDAPGELERCAKMGFKAVKIQGSLLRFFPEDERMIGVYKKAADLGIPIMTHCGPNVENFAKDPKEIKERQYAEPKGWLPILKRFPGLKLSLAHFAGATHYYEDALEVMDQFPGVMTDTAMVMYKWNTEEATKFVKRVGADRVIFGTDYPGEDLAKDIELVAAMGLTDEEKEKIFSRNVISFFGLS
jgi:predicted TIM-barrel fold metal-dependent hydrolase